VTQVPRITRDPHDLQVDQAQHHLRGRDRGPEHLRPADSDALEHIDWLAICAAAPCHYRVGLFEQLGPRSSRVPTVGRTAPTARRRGQPVEKAGAPRGPFRSARRASASHDARLGTSHRATTSCDSRPFCPGAFGNQGHKLDHAGHAEHVGRAPIWWQRSEQVRLRGQGGRQRR
jgi:hypothetical protein